MKRKIAFFCILILFSSCTLKYEQAQNAEDSNPEFIYSGVRLHKYEDNNEVVSVEAETLEQYKNSSITYGKEIYFKTFDKENELQTEGSCGYISADTKNNKYELFDDIKIYSKSENANFYADVLKWNGNNEQLTTGRLDNVKIEKDDTVLYGTGFSASGISHDFSFSGTVSGQIITDDKGEDVE